MKRLIDHPLVKDILGKMLDIRDEIRDTWGQADKKKLFASIFPYLLVGYLINKLAELYHLCQDRNCFRTLSLMFAHADKLFRSYRPSLAWKNMLAGIIGSIVMYFYVFQKRKDAKKFRKGEEYGSARWGNQKDIKPFMDVDFKKNILLTETERITMNGRPRKAKYARNKNILVIGGSGSGKTRFFIKPSAPVRAI